MPSRPHHGPTPLHRRGFLLATATVATAATAGCAALGIGGRVPAATYDATGEVRGGLVAADHYGDDAGRAMLLETPRARDQSDLDARGGAAAFLDGTDYDSALVLAVQQVLAADGTLALDGASWAGDRGLRASFAVDHGAGDGHVHTLLVRFEPESIPDDGIRRVRLRGLGDLDVVYNPYAEPLPE